MKCPQCGYEDVEFIAPASSHCPECGWEYIYPFNYRKQLKDAGII